MAMPGGGVNSVLRDGTQLFFHCAKRQHDFSKKFVHHLREAGVDGGESADQAFITGGVFEIRAGRSVVAEREQEK
jgi:hypothetical protein